MKLWQLPTCSYWSCGNCLTRSVVDFAWNAKYEWDNKEETFIRTHRWNRDKKRWEAVNR
jgi:hypothetical protein